jgi:hypothetical protein
MKKVIFTLNVNDYSPEITELTFPLMRYYARKIGAQFRVITERKFPEWPVVCEKLQCGQLAGDADWVIFFDADTLIHPECLDFTALSPNDVVLHNARDMANLRHQYDEVQTKDGRHLGTCGWFTMAPKKCFGIWDPPDLPMDEIIRRCLPTLPELAFGMAPEHLADDFNMSRNIARHGYKHDTVLELMKRLGYDWSWFWHAYLIPTSEKVRQMRETLWSWKCPHPALFKGQEWFFERMK